MHCNNILIRGNNLLNSIFRLFLHAVYMLSSCLWQASSLCAIENTICFNVLVKVGCLSWKNRIVASLGVVDAAVTILVLLHQVISGILGFHCSIPITGENNYYLFQAVVNVNKAWFFCSCMTSLWLQSYPAVQLA